MYQKYKKNRMVFDVIVIVMIQVRYRKGPLSQNL